MKIGLGLYLSYRNAQIAFVLLHNHEMLLKRWRLTPLKPQKSLCEISHSMKNPLRMHRAPVVSCAVSWRR